MPKRFLGFTFERESHWMLVLYVLIPLMDSALDRDSRALEALVPVKPKAHGDWMRYTRSLNEIWSAARP
jgi:hypothetical protein